jgi:2-dehydro-3-deoxygluconokinase
MNRVARSFARIVTLGEGMIEISGRIGGEGAIAYGGDVLNVSVALARLGLAPAFMTALGRDAWSDEMVAGWEAEGVDCSLIGRDPVRVPGLYGIRTDAAGERSFTYWRDASAARALFALPESVDLCAKAAQANLFFLSGITLSLYGEADRARIADIAMAVRDSGGMVAFDGNYRPRGWSDAQAARAAFAAFAPQVTLALPTLGDEMLLHDATLSAQAVADRWHAAGAEEVAVKLGADGAFVSLRNEAAFLIPAPAVTPVDTTGAGDSFDAGYLAARLAGRDPAMAAAFGHRLAGETIRHRGAIPPREAVAAIHLAAVH